MSLNTSPNTLSRWLLEEQRKLHFDTDLIIVLQAIASACKAVSAAVQRAGITHLFGLAGSTNVQGEEVKKLDVIANEFFQNYLRDTGKVCCMASEEDDEIIVIEKELSGKYVVVFDPLDGSSNIDASLPVGSIFGVYERISPLGDVGNIDDVLQPGRNLVAAGYGMFSSASAIVLSIRNGVNAFALDPLNGEYTITHSNITIKKFHNIYSCNEGNFLSWDSKLQAFINAQKSARDNKKACSQRYVGSMIADVHRTLLYGGIFMYPADKTSTSGKLRLLYECNPMSFLMEQAGGKSTTGSGRVLDVAPQKVHQRVPIFLGSVENVDEVLSFIQ